MRASSAISERSTGQQLWQAADEEERGCLERPDDEPPDVEWQSYCAAPTAGFRVELPLAGQPVVAIVIGWLIHESSG